MLILSCRVVEAKEEEKSQKVDHGHTFEGVLEPSKDRDISWAIIVGCVPTSNESKELI